MLCADCGHLNCDCTGINAGNIQNTPAACDEKACNIAKISCCGVVTCLILGFVTGGILHSKAGLELGNGDLSGENSNNGTLTVPSEAFLAYGAVTSLIYMAGCSAMAIGAVVIPKVVKSCWSFLRGRQSNTESASVAPTHTPEDPTPPAYHTMQ